LKGLATLAGTTALTKSSLTPLHAEPMANPIHLNVVVHGTVALEFRTNPNPAQNRVFLRIPSVTGHVFKAGASTAPQPLSAGTLKIDLPGFPNKPLPPELQDPTRTDLVVVRKKGIQLNQANLAFITFDLPFPESIMSARAQEFRRSGKFFDDPNSLLQVQPQKVPLCLVLQYTVQESSIPVLPGQPGTVLAQHRNWHIYAEPGADAAKAMQLLANLQAFTQQNNDPELKALTTQLRDAITKRNSPAMLDAGHTATAFDSITSLYIGLNGLELSKAALNQLNLAEAPVQKPDDLGFGEDLSLEEMGSAVPSPTGGGGSRVGTCAPLILVS
jgi:hypothetical protein